MYSNVRKYLWKLTNIKYLSVWAILFFDTVVCIFSTVLSLLLVRLITLHPLGDSAMLQITLASTVSSILVFLCFRTYRKAIRHTALSDLIVIALACVLKVVLCCSVLVLLRGHQYGMRFLAIVSFSDIVLSIILLCSSRVILVSMFGSLRNYFRVNSDRKLKNVLVYGTSDKSVAIVTRLHLSSHFKIAGFIEYGKHSPQMFIGNYKIRHFEDEEDILRLKETLELDGILFASASDAAKERQRLVDFAIKSKLSIFFSPAIDEATNGNISRQTVREIKIEDLLGREEIKINLSKIESDLKGKVILVTGAAGSIGSELCRQLAKFGVGKLVMFDNGETPMHNLRLEFDEKYKGVDYVPVIGDVRQTQRLDFVFRNFHPEIVFHAAAYKHVPLMEDNPCEAVLVNVVGSRNVADKCIEYGVEKMVMISTDKAVNPTNVMGCTKRLAEIYVQSLGAAVSRGEVAGKTKFITTRFGNVLGSNGSVIPRFREQIASGGPVTVTHKDITRFFMTIPEACRLVMEAATMGTGNQIFIFDMGESVKIVDLATRMIELAGLTPGEDIKIEFTGLRPGEKLYEEVLANTENTDPTSHDRIRIARTRDYSYEDAKNYSIRLEQLSREVNIPEMVVLMKEIVPEYISNNSRFCMFDKKN